MPHRRSSRRRHSLRLAAGPVAALIVVAASGCATSRTLPEQRTTAPESGGGAASPITWRVPTDTRAAAELVRAGRRGLALLREFDASTPEQLERTYKPYLHVYDAQGREPITKGTGGLYPHHRGVFVGWNKVRVGNREVDFWHMRGGVQRVLSTTPVAAAEGRAALAAEVAWMATDGEVLVREYREIIACATSDDVLARFDVVSTLFAPQDADVALDGDPEHAGVQFRASNAVHEGPPEGKAAYTFERDGVDAHRERDLRWVLMSCRVGGQRYHVLHMNDPNNPPATLYSAYRDYGRFGAFFRAVIPRGGMLRMRYGFVVFSGEPPPRETLERSYATFAD
ncbi:MAG: hypothetical protein CHACPFDD_02605 [Phycisphaerae bacterium]|nr:hypothetical protein [Phycisphaerae bacterium]